MKRQTASLLAAMLGFCLLITGCSEEAPKHNGPPRDSAAVVFVPEATGTVLYGSEPVLMDASNTAEGYFMLRYTGDADKVKSVVTAPDGTSCSYPLAGDEEYHTIPLTFGSGIYKVTVYEGMPNETRDDLYAAVFSQEFTADEIDEFKPFLYPNQYVSFTLETASVKQGEALAANTYSDLEVIANVYNYVIQNVTYDDNLAENVSFGYIPDVDRTLSTKKGICFDYAALMTCMLRTQRIPTKLEVGYSGDKLHAWISAYVAEAGWIDKIIEFNGEAWNLMDPTLAANNSAEAVKKHIGDGSKYLIKYQY